MVWRTIDRPGYFGTDKGKMVQEYTEKFGPGRWRIVHQYENKFLSFLETCELFEEAYFIDSVKREYLWANLRKDAREVYDFDESDIDSGLDYCVQNNVANHIQDIAIRNVFMRRGWEFEGDSLIQIRGNAKPFGPDGKKYGQLLSPYRVKFHEPQKIIKPFLEGMWGDDTVESFYQNNKVLQINSL